MPVQKHHVDRLVHQLQPLGAAGGGLHPVVVEPQRERLADPLLVVDHEDPSRGVAVGVVGRAPLAVVVGHCVSTSKRAPPSVPVVAAIRHPWASTMSFTMFSPNPVLSDSVE